MQRYPAARFSPLHNATAIHEKAARPVPLTVSFDAMEVHPQHKNLQRHSYRMPLITVASNVAASKFPADFNLQFTKLLAELLGKPASRIALLVTAGAQLTHGTTQDPSCFIEVSSFIAFFFQLYIKLKIL